MYLYLLPNSDLLEFLALGRITMINNSVFFVCIRHRPTIGFDITDISNGRLTCKVVHTLVQCNSVLLRVFMRQPFAVDIVFCRFYLLRSKPF